MKTQHEFIEKQLAPIRAKFVATLDDRVLDIDRLSQNLVQNSEPMENILADIRMSVHKIGGVAGTLGFLQIGELAAQCEKLVLEHPSDGESSKLPAQLNALMDEMEKVVVSF
jgi:chemotaxis protein histidine kinase CheA